MLVPLRKSNRPDCVVVMMSRSWLSEKARLPMKLMALTLVAAPSLISNTRFTRLLSSSMILGSTDGGEAALPAVDVEDALHVGLRAGAREHRARLELHLGAQRLLVDLAVALEGHLVDDRVLDHGDEHARALAVDAHVGEQAGGEQRLDGLVDLAGIVGIADVELEIGAHRLRLDAPVARDLDVADQSPLCACAVGCRQRSPARRRPCAKNAAAATRIKCQPPDLHIPILGIRPVCLSVRRFPRAPYPSASGGRLRSILRQPAIRPGQHTSFPLEPQRNAVHRRL